jgi:hypothetical protein
MASARETSGRGAVDCHSRTAPGSTNVRAGAAIELSHTGSVALGNNYFLNNAGGHRGMFAPPIRGAQGDDMEFVGRFGCGGDSDRNVSVFSANSGRQTGAYGAGCRARRFPVRGFANGRDFID